MPRTVRVHSVSVAVRNAPMPIVHRFEVISNNGELITFVFDNRRMEDVPQPSHDPYTVGEKVRIYVGPDDIDSKFHGRICEVREVYKDDLDLETGRTNDAYSYTLQDVKTDDILDISFRHSDLVPVENIH